MSLFARMVLGLCEHDVTADKCPHCSTVAGDCPVDIPDVRFLVERDGKYLNYDRHGEDRIFLSDWDAPFVCRWDSAEEARRFMRFGDRIVVEVDGELMAPKRAKEGT